MRQGNLSKYPATYPPRERIRKITTGLAPFEHDTDGYILSGRVLEYTCAACGHIRVVALPKGTVPGQTVEIVSKCCRKTAKVIVRGYILTDGMERETAMINRAVKT